MPPKLLSKQNGIPLFTGLPSPLNAGLQVWNPPLSPSAMNIYSALTLQLGANAHSIPPPSVHVHVVTVWRPAVEMVQLPHKSVVHVSTTAPRVGTKAAPPLT